jgi:hypothetical protein
MVAGNLCGLDLVMKVVMDMELVLVLEYIFFCEKLNFFFIVVYMKCIIGLVTVNFFFKPGF